MEFEIVFCNTVTVVVEVIDKSEGPLFVAIEELFEMFEHEGVGEFLGHFTSLMNNRTLAYVDLSHIVRFHDT